MSNNAGGVNSTNVPIPAIIAVTEQTEEDEQVVDDPSQTRDEYVSRLADLPLPSSEEDTGVGSEDSTPN